MLIIKRRTNILLVLSLSFVGILFIVCGVLFYETEEKIQKKSVLQRELEIISYNEELQNVYLSIGTYDDEVQCSLEDKDYIDIEDGKCYIVVPIQESVLYFKNEDNEVINTYNLEELFIDSKIRDTYYIPVGGKLDFNNLFVFIGDVDYEWKYNEEILTINDNIVTGNIKGVAEVELLMDSKVLVNSKIIVTDVIVDMPVQFDEKKPDLPCGIFSQDEAQLLDKILERRISDAGYRTRAGAVAAARFLTLEFPYKIGYYYENGRLNSTGRNYVDGEGRYYHKGLYLDESKYNSIEASLLGPTMWGCLLKNLEPGSREYVHGKKYPNGLDCSGFVTWVLYNAGFDVGDRGAGESPSPGQLTDLGDFQSLTKSLIYSDKIKVGDLLNFWGHISIIVGIDDNNFYVAESLNTFYGVVIKTYPKNKIRNTFSYVVLMDDVYKSDGNITNMWK